MCGCLPAAETVGLSAGAALSKMLQLLQDSSTRAQEKQDRRRAVIERELEEEYQYMTRRGRIDQPQPDEAQRAGQRQAQIQEGVRLRLEGIGYRLGYCLAERCVALLSAEHPGASSGGITLSCFVRAQACQRKTANTEADGATTAASSRRDVSKPTCKLVLI